MSRNSRGWGRLTLAGWTLLCLALGFLGATVFDPVSEPVAQTGSALPGAYGSFSALAKQASPGVVNVSAVKVLRTGGQQMPSPFGEEDPFKDFFDRFFKDQVPREYRQRGLGTGFLIDKEGYILTNNHVVANTDRIMVRMSDEREYDAKIIGRDPKTDLALIKIEPDGPLSPLPLGDSDNLEVGDWVAAIGNPFGLGHTVTAGIVSAKYRQIGMGSYDNFIQTDATINPGNSGGPLLNTAGEVVGINTAIFSRTGGSVGIGFAIPVNMAKDLLPQLKEGKVVRGWLGVMIQKVTSDLQEKLNLEDQKGALVGDVTPGGPADEAGIRRGDVIVSFDGQEVKEMRDLPYMVGSTAVGKEVEVGLVRNGKEERIRVKIGELQEGQTAAAVEEVKPKLGLVARELTPEIARQLGLSETGGVVVVEVESGSPAERAGLREGDLIVEVDQVPMKDLRQFYDKIDGYKAGDTILFLVKRQGNTVYLTLKAES